MSTDTIDQPHYVRDYTRHVRNLMEAHPLDDAMSLAVGGRYDEVGLMLARALEACGLQDGMTVIDIGCGSGRVAKPLGQMMPNLDYLGLDIVPELLDYAERQCPATFQFALNRDLRIPSPDGSADMIFAFSVFTHLLPEESFIYLEDAKRALKPGGVIVFSFLEAATCWHIFASMIEARKASNSPHMSTFTERPMIEAWASHLGFLVGYSTVGGMAQTVATLKKP